MMLLQVVEAAGRAAFLAASMCTGGAIIPMSDDCVRVEGNASCSFPDGIKVSGETLFLEWQSEHRFWPVLLARGNALVQRGTDRFSANEALLRWDAQRSLKLRELWFSLDPQRTMDLRCSR
jgi:hypothetical protein